MKSIKQDTSEDPTPPKAGSYFWAAILFILVTIFVVQWLTGTSAGLDSTSPWSEDDVWQSPTWLLAWLTGFVGPMFLGSAIFAWKHVAARWLVVAWILSHIPVYIDFGEMTVGMVGWVHVLCWTPALVKLARDRAEVPINTPYGVWVHFAIFVLSISLIFDAIQAIDYLPHLVDLIF